MPGSVRIENIHLGIHQLLEKIDQPTEENVNEISQIIQLYDSADPTRPKLIYKYFNLINLFREKCDQFVLAKLHNSIFDIITHQFLSCLCQLTNLENVNCKYLLKICMIWWKYIQLVPNQLKLKAAQQNIRYFHELASVLHKIGHYLIQSKCVEVIFDYVDTGELLGAIFTNKKWQNTLSNLSTSTGSKKLSNLQLRLFLNNLNYHTKMEKCQVLSIMASNIIFMDQPVEKPMNSEHWIDFNKSTDSISFAVNNSTFFENDDNPSTSLILEFYLDDIINVSLQKPNQSEVQMQIKLKSNAIFDTTNRKYNLSSITMTFMRQSSSMKLFQQIDFKFDSNISTDDIQQSNVIYKLKVFIHQLYEIDNYLCTVPGPNELPEYIALDSNDENDNDKIAKSSLHQLNDKSEQKIIGYKHQILQVSNEKNDSKFIIAKEPETIIEIETQSRKINEKSQNKKSNIETIIDQNNAEKQKIAEEKLLNKAKTYLNVSESNGIDENIGEIAQNILLNENNDRQSAEQEYDDIGKETHVYNPKTYDDILSEYRKLRQKNKEAKAAAAKEKHSSSESSNNIANILYNPPILLQLPKIIENRRKSSAVRQPKNKNIKKPTNIAAPSSNRLKNSVSSLRSRKYLDEFLKLQSNQLNQSGNDVNTNAAQDLNDVVSTTNNSIQNVNHKTESNIAKTNNMKSNKIENNTLKTNHPSDKKQTNSKRKTVLKSNKKSTEKDKPSIIAAPQSAGLKFSVSLLRGREYRDNFLKSQRSQSNQLDNEINTNEMQALNKVVSTTNNSIQNVSIAITDDQMQSSQIENVAAKINDPSNKKQANMKRKIDLNESIQQDDSTKPKKIVKTRHNVNIINDMIDDQPRRCNLNKIVNELNVPNIVTIDNQMPETHFVERIPEEQFEKDNHNNTVNSDVMEVSPNNKPLDAYTKMTNDFHEMNDHITINDIVPPEFQQKLNEIEEIFIRDVAEKILSLHQRVNKKIDKYKEIQQNAFTLEIEEKICKFSMIQQKNFEEIQNKSLAVIQEYRQLFSDGRLNARMAASHKEKSIVLSREIWQKFIDEFLDRIQNQFQNVTNFE